jgi:hypothetical protein
VLASSYSKLPSGAVPKGMNNEGEPTSYRTASAFHYVPKGMNNEGEPILPKLHFMKNTLNAYGLITLPLREGKIFCKKILGGGLETKPKNRQF